jgi:hypothetical protein
MIVETEEVVENTTLKYIYINTHKHTHSHTHTHIHTYAQVSLCGVFSQVWSALSVTVAGRIQRGQCCMFVFLFTYPYLLFLLLHIFLIFLFPRISVEKYLVQFSVLIVQHIIIFHILIHLFLFSLLGTLRTL